MKECYECKSTESDQWHEHTIEMVDGHDAGEWSPNIPVPIDICQSCQVKSSLTIYLAELFYGIR